MIKITCSPSSPNQESFHLPVQGKRPDGKVKSAAGSAAGVGKKSNPETLSWRFGPAKIWYDQMGVVEDGSNLNYGFKLKEVHYSMLVMLAYCWLCFIVQGPVLQDSREKGGGQDTHEDAFLMVTQQHWEDKILWEVPYTPGPAVSGAGKQLTWHLARPTGVLLYNCDVVGGVWRTVGDSPSVTCFANKPSDSSTAGHAKTQSIFPVENFDLIYKRWEDDIIYDSDAVECLPQPSLPLIDPNDPNFILGVPEEPPVTLPTEKEKKVKMLPSHTPTSLSLSLSLSLT